MSRGCYVKVCKEYNGDMMPHRPLAFLVALATLASSQTGLAADTDPWIARDKALHFDASVTRFDNLARDGQMPEGV